MGTASLEKLTACLYAVHTAEGIAEGIQGARFTVSPRREVFFHFSDNHDQFFRNSVPVLLFAVAALQVFAWKLVFLAPPFIRVFPRGLGAGAAGPGSCKVIRGLGAAGSGSCKVIRFSPPGVRRLTAGHS